MMKVIQCCFTSLHWSCGLDPTLYVCIDAVATVAAVARLLPLQEVYTLLAFQLQSFTVTWLL